jgi:hypothetical protein
VNELFDVLCVMDDNEEMVDKLDIEVALESILFFISGEFGLSKEDFVSEKEDSQSKKSSVLSEISS